MIPYQDLNPTAVSYLMQHLNTEINRALSERRPLEEKWVKWNRMYRAIPEFEVKEFPFYGAANLVLPVVATDVDTVYSRIMGILFATKNLWTVSALNDATVEFAPRLSEFLEWAQEKELNAYESTADWIQDICLLGTGILKQRYRREMQTVYQFRETAEGVVESHETILLHDHPQQDHVSLYDFLVPSIAVDVKSAPWCAERIRLTWQQLKARERAGIYQNVDRLAAQQGQLHPEHSMVLRSMQENDLVVPGVGHPTDVWEVWLDYDVKGDGNPRAVVCTIHLPTMTYLRIDWNPFFHQEKPYSKACYLRQPKRFYGIGLAEMNEHFQEEVTTMHNQRLDNATLANSVMMKGRKNIGIKEDEPIFPGRWFLLDNLDDVQTMPLGQKYDSTVPYEQLTLSYASRRTGVNDYITGEFSPGMGYSTATVGVQQLQQSAKRFDQVMKEIRGALGESGRRCVELYQQYDTQGKEYLAMGQKDGAMVEQVLRFPLELIRASVGVDVTATSAAFNKEVEVRTNTMIMQMTTQHYQTSMQALQIALNPAVPVPIQTMALQMVSGNNILMRRLLDSYGVQDADQLVPELSEVMGGVQQQQQQQGLGPQQALGGGQAGSQGLLPPSGMGYAGGMAQGQQGYSAAAA